MISDSKLRRLVYIKLLTVPLLNLCLADGCHPLGFIVASGWMMYAWFQSVLGMFAVRLVTECFTDGFFRATLRAHRSASNAAAVLLRLCLCWPCGPCIWRRSTTALDRIQEGEKALLALILRLTPSPSSSSSQGWRAEGDADPTVLLMPAVPDPVLLAPWLPVQLGASPRSGGPRPGAAAAATGPARSGPRPPVGPVRARGRSSPCMLVNKVDYRFKASLFGCGRNRKQQNK